MGKNISILIVIDSLDVNDSSGTKGRLALIASLKKLNFKVTVLHYTGKDVQLNDINCIKIKEVKCSINYVLSRIQRKLYRWFKFDISKYTEPVLGFSFGFFNDVKSIKKALKKQPIEDFNMLWTLSKGNSYRPHRAVLALPEWHNKWYAYVHDPYPQQLYPRPYNFVPYGHKKKRMFFRQITFKAKKMVFPSELLKTWMESYYSEIKHKSVIVPHQIPEQQNLLTETPVYFNPDAFNVLHAGNLLDLRNPEPLVEAFEKFLILEPAAKKDSALLFLGKPSVFQSYLKEKSETIPQLYVSDDYVDFNSVYSMQMKASVNVILEAKSEISPFLPGKFPHCVAANKPIVVIGPYYSECKRILGENYEYSYEFDEVDELTQGLVELYKAWKTKIKTPINQAELVHYMSPEYLKAVLEIK